MKSLCGPLLLVSFVLSVSMSEAADSFNYLVDSKAKLYQTESHFGPEIGLINPIFNKKGKLELSLSGHYSTLSSLMEYAGVSGSAVYHINQRHAIEPIWFQTNFSAKLSDFAISEVGAKIPGSITNANELSVDVPKSIFAASYMFSPFYSKVHLGSNSVAYLDFYTALGLAYVKNEAIFAKTNLQGQTSSSIGASIALGARFMMRSRWGLKFELRDFIYKASNIGSEELVNTLQVTAGLSIFFASFPRFTGI